MSFFTFFARPFENPKILFLPHPHDGGDFLERAERDDVSPLDRDWIDNVSNAKLTRPTQPFFPV